MKILLRADVESLGKRGDLVEVADGYARNYLVPRGFAVKASKGIERQAESMRRARVAKDARDLEGARALAVRLEAAPLRITARAGAGAKLFGSVTAADVSQAIESSLGVEVDRRKLQLDEPIRSLGLHEVAVRLHPDVDVALRVEVVAAD